jgi:GGDEF domain-containing protein
LSLELLLLLLVALAANAFLLLTIAAFRNEDGHERDEPATWRGHAPVSPGDWPDTDQRAGGWRPAAVRGYPAAMAGPPAGLPDPLPGLEPPIETEHASALSPATSPEPAETPEPAPTARLIAAASTADHPAERPPEGSPDLPPPDPEPASPVATEPEAANPGAAGPVEPALPDEAADGVPAQPADVVPARPARPPRAPRSSQPRDEPRTPRGTRARFVLPPMEADDGRMERAVLSLLGDPPARRGATPSAGPPVREEGQAAGPGDRLVDGESTSTQPGTVVALAVEGLEELITASGRPAADALASRVLEALLRSARPVDRVASVGPGHFRVLLVGADEAVAARFVSRVRTAVDRRITAAAVPLRVAAGWAETEQTGRLDHAVRTAEERRRHDTGPRTDRSERSTSA